MKTLLRAVLLMVASCSAVLSVGAAFESIKVEASVSPLIPVALKQSNLTDARVVVVVGVGPDGRVTGHLVTAYTHEQLVKPVVEAMLQWNFTPARLNGEPVAAQLPMTVSIDQTGMVVCSIGMEMTEYFMNQMMGAPLVYRPYRAMELDRVPVGINLASPKYAKDAAAQGVHGTVKVNFFIDESGTVKMPAVDGASHPYLMAIAVAAVRDWKFEPATSAGRPVLTEVSQEFIFRAEP